MIESNIIKRFLVKKFMQNNDCDLRNITEISFKNLSTRFFLNETVLIISKNTFGKITSFSKDENKYGVQIENTVINVPFEDLQRRFPIEMADIFGFFELITISTPLGRILIENVFEKISKPDFGGRSRHNTQSFTPKIHKMDMPEKRQVRLPNKENVYVEEMKVQIPKLEMENLKRLEIEGFEGEKLSQLLKIYCFFSKFYKITQIKALSLEHLSKDILNTDYNTQLIMKFHKFLIESIEKDIEIYKARFINEIQLLLRGLPEFKSSEGLPTQFKKRSLIDQDNWKTETKAFLFNLAISSENENVLVLNHIEDVSTRLNLLCFLINISCFTDTVRNYVNESMNSIKTDKPVEGLHCDKNSDQESSDSNEALLNLLSNPLRSHIGYYQNKLMFLVDTNIIIKDVDRYYILGLKDAKTILKDLDSKSKSDKNIVMNLRTIIHDIEK